MKYIFGLKDIPEDKLPLTGGKARSLAYMLSDLKLNVPEGYVITSEAFVDGKLKEDADRELHELLPALNTEYTYAVRSSAINEDGENASFAGQYETITDVKVDDIPSAVEEVISSKDVQRVKGYTESFGEEDKGIAVVIQRFVRPTFAGVLFTSDPLTGRDDKMVGNYVKGEGEKLVSGAENAEVFSMDSVKYRYEGNAEFRKFAKSLWSSCRKIRLSYGMPMDIEWAVSEGKVYILQARPITTLRRIDSSTYRVNGSMSGYKLLTRTNVGEIFMKPVSPMTFSVLEKINDVLGLPDWLDNIYGQPYMNISVMCSAFVAFGRTEEKAYESLKDLVGNVPEGTRIPISPFDKKTFLRKVKTLVFPKEKSKLTKKQKLQMVEDLADISRGLIEEIKLIGSSSDLYSYWNNKLQPYLNDGLSSIMAASGTAMVPLFMTRGKITKIAGEEMSNRLCGGCVGILDSMKPLLLIEDVIDGTLSEEEYIRICGHRSADEMELMAPRPYEDPTFPKNLIEEHRKSGINLHEMQENEHRKFKEALAEFKEKYPSKSKWIDKQLKGFAHANDFREEIRSKGVVIFSVFREYIRKAGELSGLGDDIFYLSYLEMFDLLQGKGEAVAGIPARKATYAEYLKYPSFPNVILGRFDPEKWTEDTNRRSDFYCEDTKTSSAASDVKGFPGAAGQVTGTVRVIASIDEIDQVQQGDILVTTATNIGWTLVFPKVAAVVTDIGAPLSHAAIVAREFGIPAVVGCGNATTVLRTGDVVTVDGSSGTVTKV
ncbi:pyruvate, water dikinase [Oscillospiraceae bacterium]|nr:pyruvate, water dikinase [Oscillospiraceae bacterium]